MRSHGDKARARTDPGEQRADHRHQELRHAGTLALRLARHRRIAPPDAILWLTAHATLTLRETSCEWVPHHHSVQSNVGFTTVVSVGGST